MTTLTPDAGALINGTLIGRSGAEVGRMRTSTTTGDTDLSESALVDTGAWGTSRPSFRWPRCRPARGDRGAPGDRRGSQEEPGRAARPAR